MQATMTRGQLAEGVRDLIGTIRAARVQADALFGATDDYEEIVEAVDAADDLLEQARALLERALRR